MGQAGKDPRAQQRSLNEPKRCSESTRSATAVPGAVVNLIPLHALPVYRAYSQSASFPANLRRFRVSSAKRAAAFHQQEAHDSIIVVDHDDPLSTREDCRVGVGCRDGVVGRIEHR